MSSGRTVFVKPNGRKRAKVSVPEGLKVCKEMPPIEKYNIAYQFPEYAHTSCGAIYAPLLDRRLKFKSVLDVGCGAGYAVTYFLVEGKSVKGIEPCDELLKNILKPLHFNRVVQKGMIQGLPFPNDTFDLVMSTDVLEHIKEEDIDKSIKELIRVSKRYVFASIALTKAIFLDLNLHETVKPAKWWREKFEKYKVKRLEFRNKSINSSGDKLHRAGGLEVLYEKY